MTIYAIFDEHDVYEYDDNVIADVLIGYVENEATAKRLCNMTEQIAKNNAEHKLFDNWQERNQKWNENNKHRYIDVKRIHDYIEKRERLINKMNSIPKPNLTNIPVDRHTIVMGGYYNKTHALNLEIMDLTEKIKNSLDIEVANSINEALNIERDNYLGPMPAFPCAIYRRHYKEIEKLA